MPVYDATSECIYAEFFPAEDRISVMTVVQKVLQKFGVPGLVYVDQAAAHGKAGVFRQFSGWQDYITDLERTLYKFGSRMIFATSPQAISSMLIPIHFIYFSINP